MSYQQLTIFDPVKPDSLREAPMMMEEMPPVIPADTAAAGDLELLRLLLGRAGRLPDNIEAAVSREGMFAISDRNEHQLMHRYHVSATFAQRVVAICELVKRAPKAQRSTRPKVISPEAVLEVMAPLVTHCRHEQFWCLPIDARGNLIGEPAIITMGDVDGTDAGPRSFFRHALSVGATQAVAVHNHPTGDPTPSPADLAVTSRLVAAGRAIDVRCTDHVVIGDGGRMVSLRRNNPEVFR